MKIKEGYLLKSVAGNQIVVPVGSIDFDGLISLNESGALLWRALETDTGREDLIRLLLEHYEISEENAARDVDVFLQTLRKEELIDG